MSDADIVTTPMPSHGTLDDMNAMPSHMDAHGDAAYGGFDSYDGGFENTMMTPTPTPSPEMMMTNGGSFGTTSLPTATFSPPW